MRAFDHFIIVYIHARYVRTYVCVYRQSTCDSRKRYRCSGSYSRARRGGEGASRVARRWTAWSSCDYKKKIFFKNTNEFAAADNRGVWCTSRRITGGRLGSAWRRNAAYIMHVFRVKMILFCRVGSRRSALIRRHVRPRRALRDAPAHRSSSKMEISSHTTTTTTARNAPSRPRYYIPERQQ